MIGGSSVSATFTRRDSVFGEGEECIKRVDGPSKNGSLGARARFCFTFEALSEGF